MNAPAWVPWTRGHCLLGFRTKRSANIWGGGFASKRSERAVRFPLHVVRARWGDCPREVTLCLRISSSGSKRARYETMSKHERENARDFEFVDTKLTKGAFPFR